MYPCVFIRFSTQRSFLFALSFLCIFPLSIDSHEGCECPAGYYGHSCEFKELEPNDDADDSQNNEDTTIPVVTTCEITCENGGVCRKGKKDIDAYGGVANGVAHLSQTHDDNFEHCVCPTGFIGLHVSDCDYGCGQAIFVVIVAVVVVPLLVSIVQSIGLLKLTERPSLIVVLFVFV